MMNLTLLELAAVAVALDEKVQKEKENVGFTPSMVLERNRKRICHSLQRTD
jgi:hypothetical protein